MGEGRAMLMLVVPSAMPDVDVATLSPPAFEPPAWMDAVAPVTFG